MSALRVEGYFKIWEMLKYVWILVGIIYRFKIQKEKCRREILEWAVEDRIHPAGGADHCDSIGVNLNLYLSVSVILQL